MAEGGAEPPGATHGGPPPPWPAAAYAALFAAFGALGLGLYRRALLGPFVSDDIAYLSHPYTAPLDLSNLFAVFDPWGPAKLYAANYAPLHLLFTAVERHIFADGVLGYHLVNVALHAANAVLVAALLRRAELPRAAALLGALCFAVHPANVEAVAWVSQLKTLGSFAFGFGALLALRAAPGWATALFAASLLTKASGLFALPAAGVLVWLGRGPRGAPRDWAWVALWAGLAGLYALPQMASFAHLGAVEVPAFDDPWVQARTIAAVGMRYLLMAATSFGVSAFHEPAPVTSWLDPWWLAAIPCGLALGARFLYTLARRDVEALFWMIAASSFAPVSQLFPFLNPVADRYLYFVLPGLLGGTLLWSRPLWESPRAQRAAAAGALALCVAFAVRSHERAGLWRNDTLLLLDAARHYPEGGTAYFLRARRAVQEGDAEGAVEALRVASQRGIDRFMALRSDPGLAALRGNPGFEALIDEMAGRWIEGARRRGHTTQPELRVVAIAHLEREEYAQAIEAFEAALRAGGPLEPVVRGELAEARARRALAEEEREGGGHGAPTP